MNVGRVVQIIGPVVDLQFTEENIPQIYSAVRITSDGTEALVAQGMAPEPGPPEALTERIRGDIEKWRGVAAKAGIRSE